MAGDGEPVEHQQELKQEPKQELDSTENGDTTDKVPPTEGSGSQAKVEEEMSEFRKKRNKNNASAKRSRDTRNKTFNETVQRAVCLESENTHLKVQKSLLLHKIDTLKKELAGLEQAQNKTK